jgi:hypothetical protein
MPGLRFRRVFRVTVLAILWLGILSSSAAQAGRLSGVKANCDPIALSVVRVFRTEGGLI